MTPIIRRIGLNIILSIGLLEMKGKIPLKIWVFLEIGSYLNSNLWNFKNQVNSLKEKTKQNARMTSKSNKLIF